MKFDLVLCLATAAYAAPIPVVRDNVKGVAARFGTAWDNFVAALGNHFKRKVPEPSSNPTTDRLLRSNRKFLRERFFDYKDQEHHKRWVAKLETALQKLRGRVSELTEDVNKLQGHGHDHQSTVFKWSEKYSRAHPGETVTLEKIVEFAQGRLAQAEKSLQIQQDFSKNLQFWIQDMTSELSE